MAEVEGDARSPAAVRFELIEHTADIGLIAYGDSLPRAFANAAFGMFSIIAELENVAESESREVRVTADDIEMLLVDWLNELLYLFDVHRVLLRRFDILEFSDKAMSAICRGEKYDPGKHRIKLGVKAATYHMLEVDREKNQVRVIFDV